MIKLTFGKYKNPLIMYSIVMIIIIMVAIPLGLSEDAGPNWLRYSPTNNAAHDVIYMMIMITICAIIGGVFVVETLSVILQVISFKTTGKRIFKMSPLHHHYELVGWSEWRVVVTFWTAGLLLAV